ncbi:MAG: TRAP transporter large permease subunit [Bdellovibrionales bacterium]|nr:TRAP transporter large permease subunit [Bdellovibrionales bacterium]
METALPFLMFLALIVVLLSGFPVAFGLGGVAIAFGFLGHSLDLFYLSDFEFVPSKIFGIMSNVTLLAVPLFIFMGIMLERSGIAEELLTTMELVCRKVRGGLTISIVLVGALLAASTGIVGATVVTMGVLSLPTLLKRGYNIELSCGTIATSGTLGQIIPPSIVLVLLGDMMNVDVGDLFIGAILPGLFLVVLYLLYIYLRTTFQPELAPLLSEEEQKTLTRKEYVLLLLRSFVPPTLLMFVVLGSILGGVASPTEAAACGAMGALLLTWAKKRLCLETLSSVLHTTTQITSMVFMLLIGAQFFSVVFRGLAGDEVIMDVVTSLEVSKNVILLAVMVLMFVLGFFLDFIEICFIVVPIVTPLLYSLGFDPLWLAILIAINLQTSFLTPPFGFSLFYLKGVAPPEVTTLHIYKGVFPFVLLQLFALVVLWLFPAIVTWLPRIVF